MSPLTNTRKMRDGSRDRKRSAQAKARTIGLKDKRRTKALGRHA